MSFKKRPSIPPPFSELAMPSVENHYDLEDPEVLIDLFPRYRRFFSAILQKSDTREQASALMREHLGLKDKTKVRENEITSFREKLELVSTLNTRKYNKDSNQVIGMFDQILQ